jgi:hypothetical protein
MQEDKIIKKLIEHDEKLQKIGENMLGKEYGQKTLEVLEDMATRIKRIDEDRVFSYQWIKRIEDRIETQEKEIKIIKLKLEKVRC